MKALVGILTILFGMGAWLATNATWVELPILVDQLPEGWTLPSYIAVVIQLANIGPILLTSLTVLTKKQLTETPIIVAMVMTGAVASLCMAFLWKRTSFIAGAERSTALLVLLFFFALVDCSSSVVFLPFMHKFKPRYITLFYVGSGLSGLLPSVVALIQGVGQVDCLVVTSVNISTNVTDYHIESVYRPTSFPVKHFFLFTFAVMTACVVAFLLLNYLPYCKTEHVTQENDDIVVTAGVEMRKVQNAANGTSEEQKAMVAVPQEQEAIVAVPQEQEAMIGVSKEQAAVIAVTQHLGNGEQRNTFTDVMKEPLKMTNYQYIYYLILIGLLNALTNGILPSVQSYASLPYGSISYHLSVTLANIANPVGCLLVLFKSVTSDAVIGGITLIGGGCAVYILILAAMSPEPPLVDSIAGTAIVVACFVSVYFLLSFTKVAIASVLRDQGKGALFWCGAITQLGSAVGAAAMFVAINVYHVFVQKYPCT